MARRTFNDFVRGFTPARPFVFPYLSAPSTKFKAEGEFQVSIDLFGTEASDFKKLIDETFESEYQFECAEKPKQEIRKYAGRPYGPATDRDKVEIPGAIRFRFARKASGIYGPKNKKAGQRWEAKVPILSADLSTPVTAPIWGGTVGSIAYTIVPWFTNALGFGVRLQIDAVQIIDLVTQGERAPAEYGFTAVDGYKPPVALTNNMPTGNGDADVDGLAEEEAGGIDF